MPSWGPMAAPSHNHCPSLTGRRGPSPPPLQLCDPRGHAVMDPRPRVPGGSRSVPLPLFYTPNKEGFCSRPPHATDSGSPSSDGGGSGVGGLEGVLAEFK